MIVAHAPIPLKENKTENLKWECVQDVYMIESCKNINLWIRASSV